VSSQYLCESGFSRYAQTKTKYRARLDAHQISESNYQLLRRTFQNCCSPENKHIALTETCLLFSCLCFMVTFIVHNFVYSAKRQFGWKKRLCLHGSSGGVPCPLKITLQCSADKNVYAYAGQGFTNCHFNLLWYYKTKLWNFWKHPTKPLWVKLIYKVTCSQSKAI